MVADAATCWAFGDDLLLLTAVDRFCQGLVLTMVLTPSLVHADERQR
jgi:hypothetical protein